MSYIQTQLYLPNSFVYVSRAVFTANEPVGHVLTVNNQSPYTKKKSHVPIGCKSLFKSRQLNLALFLQKSK